MVDHLSIIRLVLVGLHQTMQVEILGLTVLPFLRLLLALKVVLHQH
jgi:hypothetical protein